MWICKNWFEKTDHIELHALGYAQETAVHLAESLVRNGYANLTDMQVGHDENIEGRSAKLKIKLSKSEAFGEVKKKYESDIEAKYP